MQVRPIPYEPSRFWVSSRSRPIDHVVDIFYQEEPWVKPHMECGCEDCFAKGNRCDHIYAVAAYLLSERTP